MLAVGWAIPRENDAMPTRSIVRGALSAALPLLFCACATAPIRVPAMRPAEIDMAPYRTVAIGQLRGKADGGLTQRLEEAPVATKHFQAVDQQRPASPLSDRHLRFGDLSDPSRA